MEVGEAVVVGEEEELGEEEDEDEDEEKKKKKSNCQCKHWSRPACEIKRLRARCFLKKSLTLL